MKKIAQPISETQTNKSNLKTKDLAIQEMYECTKQSN